MDAIDQIEAARERVLQNEDGSPISIELAPPLTPPHIDRLEANLGQPLPRELRTLLGFTAGINGCLDGIDFTGSTMSLGLEEIFPTGLPIAADGFGNFWVVDITPDTRDAAPVFFACHDAPVILYQSPDIALFLAEVFRMYIPPHKSLVDEVHEDRLCNVWQRNPGVLTHQTAATSLDPTVRAFAESLPEHFEIIDLRKATPGMGFSWGRYGPRTEVRRHGFERIFAYAKPPKRGFLRALLGR